MYYHTIIDVDDAGVGTVIKGELELDSGVLINSRRQLASRAGLRGNLQAASVFVGARSTAINSVAYNPSTEEMDLTFQRQGDSGYGLRPRTYRYSNVPLSQVMRLLSAESIGGYFNSYIRNQHDHRQL